MMSSALLVTFFLAISGGQSPSVSPQSISKELGGLRSVPDANRAAATTKIALEIRSLSAGPDKVNLANGLANLSTEGDFGKATLQEVATTLAESLGQLPDPVKANESYLELAQLVRYEGVKVTLNQQAYRDAVGQLNEIEAARAEADFTLTDLDGKTWTRSALKGKVVLVNFWATWCPPCRKEMPDLNALYEKYRDQGLVVLAISDETSDKVKPYLEKHPVSYPVLLDAGRKVNDAYRMAGIPNSYIYNRDGKLVAEAEDMRTRSQFEKLLAKAGIR